MNLALIKEIVSKSAPLLGSVLTISNPIAGMVVQVIAHMFSADPENINEIINRISNDKDADSKLKEIELAHQDALQQNQVEDRMNAREREKDIVKVTGKRDSILDWIAILVIIGFFLLCIVNYFEHLSDDHIVTMLIGQMSSGFLLVLSYYFGSSNK